MPTPTSEAPQTLRLFVTLPASAEQRTEVSERIDAWRRTAPASLRNFRLANPVQAHVTLARARRKSAPLPELPPSDGVPATARVINLVGSQLGPRRARHDMLSTAQLGHACLGCAAGGG